MPDFAVRTSFNAVDKISPAFRKMGNEADKFGRRGQGAFGRVNSASNRLMGAFRGLLPAISAGLVLKFTKDATEAWMKQEAAVAAVEARIAATNGALGLTSKQLQESAAQFQSVGIFGDEEILQNLTSQLMTFGNIGAANFDRVQAAALDVTTTLKGVNATGTDLQATAIMLGKAIDDPARGMANLRRVGISFTDAEADKIKAMQKSGDMLGAQNELLRLVEKQYGGTNEALRQTSAGMERAAKNTLGDVMEEIGKVIIPVRQELFRLAMIILPAISSALPPVISMIKTLAPAIMAVVGALVLWRVWTLANVAAQKIMMAVGWVKYIWMMRAAIMKAMAMTKAWTVVQKILNFIMTMNPIGLIIAGIAALVAAGYFLIKNWKKVGEFFGNLWSGIKDGFGAAADWIVERFTKMLSWVTDKWNAVKGFFRRGSKSSAEADAEAAGGRSAPNETQVQSQSMRLQGEININGAPAGSTARAQTRGPGRVDMNLVGANP